METKSIKWSDSEPKSDGGPAFPETGESFGNPKRYKQIPGMSLRDWFAGQALAGRLAGASPGQVLQASDLVHECYRIADGMTVERTKRSDGE